MLPARDHNRPVYLAAFLILLTRIPFLFPGFGSEEDAWGLMLVARNINLSGIYEVSRMPGHPVQEYLLSLIWQWPAWLVNLLTAIVSTTGVLYFMLSVKHLIQSASENYNRGYSNYISISAGLAVAFTPVFYINSTNVMDYTWALTLVIIALYATITGRYLLAGLILGIACGFRITAGAMVIPFAAWHYMNYRTVKPVLFSWMITVATALICFIPAFVIYGTGFFTYYEYFPYPPFLKNMYKATVGAWGIIGMLAIIFVVVVKGKYILSLLRGKRKNIHDVAHPIQGHHENETVAMADPKKQLQSVAIMCAITILLYTYSFLKIPQKTAFVLPMVPFIILLFVWILDKKELAIFSCAMVCSSFFMGINLDDPLRGSVSSGLSFRTVIGQTPVAIDVLSGPVPADYTKRQLKMQYAENVVDQLSSSTQKTTVIAGWWQNEVNYFALKKPNPNISYLYYAGKDQIRDSISAGNKIYFLPEQDLYNDLRFKEEFTDKMAEALVIRQ